MIVGFNRKGDPMSFKEFSVSQSTPSKDKPEDKTKAAPAGGKSTAQPAKKQNEAKAAQKS